MNRPKTHNHLLNTDFAQEWLVVFVVKRRKEMKAEQIKNGTKNSIGLVWCEDRWLTPEFYQMVAPLTDLCPELEPITQASFYDPDPTAKLD